MEEWISKEGWLKIASGFPAKNQEGHDFSRPHLLQKERL
jgi:hypothetical protein